MPEIKRETMHTDHVGIVRHSAEVMCGILKVGLVGAADELEALRERVELLEDFAHLCTYANKGHVCPDCLGTTLGTDDDSAEPCDTRDGRGWIDMSEYDRCVRIAAVARKLFGKHGAQDA